MRAGEETFPDDAQQDMVQEEWGIGEADTAEAGREENEAAQLGATEHDLSDVIEGVLDLKSEKAREIVVGCVGKDKQSFLGAYEEAIKKKQEEDSIRYFEELEKRLAGIDGRIQKLFVTGNYEDHYGPHEKAIVYIAGRLSANAGENMAKRVNGWVGARLAARVMKELESKIGSYEAKYSREKGRESEYRAEIDSIEKSLSKDKFELDILSKSTHLIEEEIKKADEEAAEGSMPKNPEESDRMARDLRRLYGQQQKTARSINRNSAIYSWKQSFYMNMNLARDESEHVLEQLKSHHAILASMINDYRKCGIAIELREGRMMLRQMRDMQEGIKKVQEEFSSTLVESTMMRGCPPNALPVYPGNAYHGARDVMDKMRREECLKAYQNLDNVFGRKA